MSPGCCLQSNISRHKSNALARELDQVLREAEPLSAAQMDSVLEVVGTRLYASACSAATQAQIETSPAVSEAAGLVKYHSSNPRTDLCHVFAVVVIMYYRRARSQLYRA